MKTICFVTCNHDDSDIIKFIKSSNEYEIRSLIFPHNEILIKTIWDSPVYPLEKVNDCIRDCDILYISSNIDAHLKKELYKIAKQYNKTVYMPETVTSSRLNIQTVNIPIILVSSLGKDLRQLDFIFGLKKYLDKCIGKVIVLSDDSRLIMFPDVYSWPDSLKSLSKLSSKTEEINSFINNIILESSASCCIIQSSSGIYNPFAPDDKENNYFISHVVDACTIDYSIFILPCNFTDDTINNTYQRIVKEKNDITIDTILIDDMYWHLSRKKENVRSIRIQDYYLNAIISGTTIEETSTASLCLLVYEDIVNKLSKPNLYQIF